MGGKKPKLWCHSFPTHYSKLYKYGTGTWAVRKMHYGPQACSEKLINATDRYYLLTDENGEWINQNIVQKCAPWWWFTAGSDLHKVWRVTTNKRTFGYWWEACGFVSLKRISVWFIRSCLGMWKTMSDTCVVSATVCLMRYNSDITCSASFF